MVPSPKRAFRGCGGTSFTLIELLIAIAIIALLVAIVFPSLGAAKEYARTVVCLTNLRGIGSAMACYHEDNRGIYMPAYYTGKRVDEDADPADGDEPCEPDTWAAILIVGDYLAADPTPDYRVIPNGSSHFRCASGTEAVAIAKPKKPHGWPKGVPFPTRDDPTFMGSYPWGPKISKKQYPADVFIHSWYSPNSDGYANGKNFFPFRPCSTNDPGKSVPLRVSDLLRPSEMCAIYDGWNRHNKGKDWFTISARHNFQTRTNIVLFDGHADSFGSDRLPQDKFGPKEMTPDELWQASPKVLWRLDQQ